MKILEICFLAICCIVLLLIGVALDYRGFIGNLAAGAFYLVITITLIDWLLERQRSRQWSKVRAQIVSALTSHLANIASEYMVTFRGPKHDLIAFTEAVGAGHEKAIERTAKAMHSMVGMMETSPKPLDGQDQAENAYSAIKWDLTQILESLLPRILALEENETELVTRLGSLDNAHREWVNEIIMDREISSGDQYSAAINTLRAAATVYDYLVDHSD